MKRVVITGMGIISSIGNCTDEVLIALKQGTSGVEPMNDFIQRGFKSTIAGTIKKVDFSKIDRKIDRFIADNARYAYLAMQEAIDDAKLTEHDIASEHTGIIIGSANSMQAQTLVIDAARSSRGIKSIGAFGVTKTMNSSLSAALATFFKIQGISFSLSSACTTSAHSIGLAYEHIQAGKTNIMFAGAGEELSWDAAAAFDAMGALSSKFNDTPTAASRPFDRNRDGFVISGGAGVLVLEEYEHALARGAKIYAELTAYAATSDGFDMVAPSGIGAVRAMRFALAQHKGRIDYINAHATSTPRGDVSELNAILQVFGDSLPLISATKSMTGHSLGASGVHEAIYSLLMLEHQFIAPSINLEHPDEGVEKFPIVTKPLTREIRAVMSNSFGFGGTNVILVFRKI